MKTIKKNKEILTRYESAFGKPAENRLPPLLWKMGRRTGRLDGGFCFSRFGIFNKIKNVYFGGLKMITLNLNVLNKMVNGVSKEATRYYLNGIHIYDKDGFRYYEATDGHVCFRAVDQIDGDALPGDHIIKMQQAIKSKLPTCELVLADAETAVIKCDVKQAFDIIDANFPNIDNIMPKNREFATQYTMFDPELIKKPLKVYGCDQILGIRPIMADSTCPAMWEWEDDGVKYTALITPRTVQKLSDQN